MSRFVLTCALLLLVSSNISAQNRITIDSLFVVQTTYLLEERYFDENVNDTVTITHLSSIMKPEIVIYTICDAFDTSIAFDRTTFFCEFNYNGKEYSIAMPPPTYVCETKSYVFRESHIFDNVLDVMPVNGIIDYYYPIMQIMESFQLKFVEDCKTIKSKYLENCTTTLYSDHPRKLIICD